MTINGEENGENNYFEKKTPCILTFNMKNKYIHFILYFFLPAFGSMLQFLIVFFTTYMLCDLEDFKVTFRMQSFPRSFFSRKKEVRNNHLTVF